MCENKQESVELWIDQFNDWCVLLDWRDLSKSPSDKEHWKADCHGMEISAFHLALPLNVWRTVKSTVVPTMTNDDNENTSAKHPWVLQKKLLQHYSGQDTVLSNRMTFMETCKQKANESIAEFESRCKYLGSKCEYSKMENPEEELIWDRFVTGIYDDKLRVELLHHKNDDGTVFSLSEVINRAKSWETATKTNTQVIELTILPLVPLVITLNFIQILSKIKQDQGQCKIKKYTLWLLWCSSITSKEQLPCCQTWCSV